MLVEQLAWFAVAVLMAKDLIDDRQETPDRIPNRQRAQRDEQVSRKQCVAVVGADVLRGGARGWRPHSSAQERHASAKRGQDRVDVDWTAGRPLVRRRLDRHDLVGGERRERSPFTRVLDQARMVHFVILRHEKVPPHRVGG